MMWCMYILWHDYLSKFTYYTSVLMLYSHILLQTAALHAASVVIRTCYSNKQLWHHLWPFVWTCTTKPHLRHTVSLTLGGEPGPTILLPQTSCTLMYDNKATTPYEVTLTVFSGIQRDFSSWCIFLDYRPTYSTSSKHSMSLQTAEHGTSFSCLWVWNLLVVLRETVMKDYL